MSQQTVQETLRLVIPGDDITEIDDETLEETKEPQTILGPGLSREGGTVCSNKCGLLRRKVIKGNNTYVYWVDCHSSRYVASRGENVIGVVIGKAGDFFRVRIQFHPISSFLTIFSIFRLTSERASQHPCHI